MAYLDKSKFCDETAEIYNENSQMSRNEMFANSRLIQTNCD